jgi:hypothetical protein
LKAARIPASTAIFNLGRQVLLPRYLESALRAERQRFFRSPRRSQEFFHGEIDLSAIRLLMLTLMLSTTLLAQELAAQLPSAPSADRDKISSEPLFAAAGTTPGAGVPVKREKVLDKKFFAVMGALGGAESFRFTSRKLVVEREYAAGAPWITSVPSDSSVVGKDLGLFAVELLVAYEMKKAHSWLPGDRILRRFWWAYPVAMSGVHIKNAIGNVRTQGPGGCTSIECAEQLQP